MAISQGPDANVSSLTRAPALSRVLIVDDNQDAATSLAMILDSIGYETCIAHDGQAGLKAACEFRPVVALLDIGMPKMNGYELARRIRIEPWGKDLLLIAISGWGQLEDHQSSQAAGFDFHLVKPVAPVILTELLANELTAASKQTM